MTTNGKTVRVGGDVMDENAIDAITNRLEASASMLSSVTTLPKPYDLYYAVKRTGVQTGWGYVTTGVGVSDLWLAVDAIKQLRTSLARARAEADRHADNASRLRHPDTHGQ